MNVSARPVNLPSLFGILECRLFGVWSFWNIPKLWTERRFISQCVPDNTVVDKSPWDVDEMQWIIFATKFKNALLFPMHAKSREIAVTSFQRSIVCGARGEVRQVKLYSHEGKCAKSPNLSQDVFVHDCSCATLSSGKPWYIPRLWIAIGNTVANTHNAKQDGKVGCDTLDCTKTLLYSMYFMVWHKPWHKHECLK